MKAHEGLILRFHINNEEIGPSGWRVGQHRAVEQRGYALKLDIAGMRSEMQRVGTRLDRIEKRLGLIEA